MHGTKLGFVGLMLLASMAFGSRVWAQSSLTWIGDLPGGLQHSETRGISGDGAKVVGYSRGVFGFEQAVSWTRSGGINAIGSLPGGSIRSSAEAVSNDGTVIGGYAESTLSGSIYVEAFRQLTGQAMVGLGILTNPIQFGSGIHGVSADGSMLAGVSGPEAIRWTSAEGMIGLGGLPGQPISSNATDISADGETIVGFAAGASGDEPFYWTSAAGMIGIGGFGGGDGVAGAISADGSTLVGWSTNMNGDIEAYSWTSAGGFIGFGFLPGATRSLNWAVDVSGDGSVVVGTDCGTSPCKPFLWDATNGLRTLENLLTNVGIDVSGVELRDAAAISDDGKTIVGTGIGPGGFTEGWVVVLDGPPSAIVPAVGPFGALWLGALLAGLGYRRLGRSTDDDPQLGKD